MIYTSLDYLLYQDKHNRFSSFPYIGSTSVHNFLQRYAATMSVDQLFATKAMQQLFKSKEDLISILQVDPTFTGEAVGSYYAWILNRYKESPSYFNEQGIQNLKKYLSIFNKVKPKLSGDKKALIDKSYLMMLFLMKKIWM